LSMSKIFDFLLNWTVSFFVQLHAGEAVRKDSCEMFLKLSVCFLLSST
jgi:hypothetical protein